MAGPIDTYIAPSVKNSSDEQGGRWWDGDSSDDAGRRMVSTARNIELSQMGRHDRNLAFASYYVGHSLPNLYQFGSSTGPAYRGPTFDMLGHAVTFNVAQSVVDTMASKVSKNRVRMAFQTFGGNWSQQRRAKQLTKFSDGLLYDLDFYNQVSDPVFIDGCVFDGGIAQGFFDDDEGKICFERVLPIEILVDERESMYGQPRNKYRRKYYARDLLLEKFGSGHGDKAKEARSAIIAAPGSDLSLSMRPPSGGRQSDMVAVFEGWHLPPSRKTTGRHTIAMDGMTFVDEGYDKPRFPFAKFIVTPPLAGYWGKGVVAQLVGIQLEINKLLKVIQRGHHLVSVPRVMVPNGAKIVDNHINNEVGAMVQYSGDQAPQWFTPQAFPPEIYQHLQYLYGKAFEIPGVNSMDAAGRKPEGVTAAIAIQEARDIGTERFVKLGQRFEQFHQDALRIMLDIARDAYKAGKNVTTRAPMSRLIEKMDWKSVNLDEDEYVMRAFPTSILPATPAGRLEKVKELLDGGIIPREHALSLLDMPDLEGVTSLETAAYQDIQRCIEKILEHGEYDTPEPYQDLALGLKIGQSAYLKARADGAPSDRLDLLCRWLDDCHLMLEMVNAPAPGAPGMGPPGMPPGPPGLGGPPPPMPPLGGPPMGMPPPGMGPPPM